MILRPNDKLDLKSIVDNLEEYRPRRRGWHWRNQGGRRIGPFDYRQVSDNLEQSVPLMAAKYFDDIDPQPEMVLTAEIASGRFEDDLRRMRMAAWHGADHMMVIRTAGQSHMDGLMEGTPEGVGGVPITRKQLRATRKALDLIEDEVGRPINLHSYVSGLAGPEIAVMFVEEGVNGAHQDPQYNVLYRNVNMVRSFVDAAEAKLLLADSKIAQIDGAHNANATARQAWKVMPELMVQHAINCAYSVACGMPEELICLSTVPPTAPPAPAMRLDLPYAVALRWLFEGYKFRAQMNSRYMESDMREVTVTHVLNLLITRLTNADIQSNITPDEGRNVPWHYNNVAALNTVNQALVGMDGLADMVKLDYDGELGTIVRELVERAVLFMEEIVERGGYFSAVEAGMFVDSGLYPDREDDGIAREIDGGVGEDTTVPRHPDYLAPVCQHFGDNPGLGDVEKGCELIGGCTICDPKRVTYIDELDEDDNVHSRLASVEEHREAGLLRPEVEWYADGVVTLNVFLPAPEQVAEYAGQEMARRLGIEDPEVVHKRTMQPAEGTFLEIKGVVNIDVDPAELDIPEKEEVLSDDEIRKAFKDNSMRVVAATVGDDEHSVGMREIIDIKHGGLETYGIKAHYLGTSVPIEKVVDAAIEIDAQAVLISTIITHGDVHRMNMQRLHELCVEKGVRDRLILVGGGTQITSDMAKECGLDGGFGRGTKGIEVASFLVKNMKSD